MSLFAASLFLGVGFWLSGVCTSLSIFYLARWMRLGGYSTGPRIVAWYSGLAILTAAVAAAGLIAIVKSSAGGMGS